MTPQAVSAVAPPIYYATKPLIAVEEEVDSLADALSKAFSTNDSDVTQQPSSEPPSSEPPSSESLPVPFVPTRRRRYRKGKALPTNDSNVTQPASSEPPSSHSSEPLSSEPVSSESHPVPFVPTERRRHRKAKYFSVVVGKCCGVYSSW